MLTIATLLFTSGFYALYRASKKVQVRESKTGRWFRHHRQSAKIAGFFLLILALLLSVAHFGPGVGIFFGLTVLMTVISLGILLLPLINEKKR